MWDCVRLHDELDLLELRLDVLDPVVDRFLVVEGDRTFTGEPKASALTAAWPRFERWASKIDRVECTLPSGASTAWDLDNLQRRHLRAALIERAGPDDLLLVGDVDEVPFPDVVPWLEGAVQDEPLQLLMEHAIFFANWSAGLTWRRPFTWDNGTMALRLRHLDHPMPRVLLGEPHGDWDGFVQHQVPDAGVHLSWLGGPDAVRLKLAAHSQQEWNTDAVRTSPHLEHCFAERVHFQGWPLEVVPLEALDPVRRRLHERRPELFDFARPPARSARRAYLAFTWLLNRGWLPEPLHRRLLRRPGLVTTWGRPLFAAVDAGIEAARTWRARRPYWKRPVDVPWPGSRPGRARAHPTALGPY